jgi:glycerol-3-phosphate O-acyltransferase / dihydroxyacetone phosphate acyltransferase
MINFDNIDKYQRFYAYILPYMKYFHNHVFYEDVEIVGEENIPPIGEPCFAISNHQNGLMDPLAKLNMFKDGRQPVYIARGDIFKKDSIAKLLKFAKVLPTFRTRDGDRNDIRKNNEIFQVAANVLLRGGTVILYPEAQHQHGRYLGDFKKGFPRICFASEELAEFKMNVKVLPVCIHYTNYERIKSKLLIVIGKPFTFEEFFDLYKTDPNLAYAKLNEKAKMHLKELVLDIQDHDHYNEYDLLRMMVSRDRIPTTEKFSIVFDEEKKVVHEVSQMKENQPEQFEELMQMTKQYREGLIQLKLRDWLINSKISWGKTILKDILLLFLLPVYFYSILTNGIPFFLPELMVKRLKDRQLFSTIRFGIGFFLFPIWYLLLFLIIGAIFNFLLAFWCLLFAAATIGFLYYYKVWVIKVFHSYRYLLLKNDPLLTDLKQLKVKILSFFKMI